MSWTLSPGTMGGARTPATGGTCVRGSGAVGRTCTGYVTPLMPPDFAPLRNPICPWEAGSQRSRAFGPNSLTMRSNIPQLQSLGRPSPRPATAADGEHMSLVPTVTDLGLSFRIAPASDAEDLNASSMSVTARGLDRLRSGLDTAPPYLYSTSRLPVLNGLDATSPRSSRATTPRGISPHLLPQRRIGNPKMWTTISMERDAAMAAQMCQ